MRFIDPSKLRLDDKWIAAAQLAADEVRAAWSVSPNAGKSKLDGKAVIWRELKDNLAKMSSKKCWYCESLQTRSDFHVDHFRPKARVGERNDHPGYWWLAFDASNYRLSCTFCNARRVFSESSGGKGDHFPIEDESCRAMTERDSIIIETPLLLDPTNALDPAMLDFNDEGKAVGNPHLCVPNSFPAEKVENTTHVFHLNERALVDKRKTLNRQLKRSFDDLMKLLPRLRDGDRHLQDTVEGALGDLLSSVADDAEYSATARAYLLGRRADSVDAAQILELMKL
jgi:uncharacterized protein (TIGR02646 family)